MTTNLLSASISSNVFSYSSRSQQFKMSLNDWKQHVTERWCISPLPFPASGSTNCLYITEASASIIIWPSPLLYLTVWRLVLIASLIESRTTWEYLWQSPGVPVRTTWCTCENYLVYLWEPSGVPVTITWSSCENHLVYLWESPGVPVRTAWCTYENSLVVPVRIALMYLWAITFVVLTDVETPIFSMGRTIPWLRSLVTKQQALLSASQLGMQCHWLPHTAAGTSLLR